MEGPQELFGTVTSHHLTSDKKKYAVVKFKNTDNLNFRLFINKPDMQIGQRVRISIEPIVVSDQTSN